VLAAEGEALSIMTYSRQNGLCSWRFGAFWSIYCSGNVLVYIRVSRYINSLMLDSIVFAEMYTLL